MKLKITLLFLICFSKIYTQKIEREVGPIKITYETYHLKDSKKTKTEKSKYYFDDTGKLLEKISFGNQHSRKLNFIGEIEQFTYLDEKIISEKRWYSDCICKNGKFITYTTDYFYDENNLLIKKLFSNPITPPFLYKYEENKTEIHSGDYYTQQIFDNQKRLIQFNQMSEATNKIRWQYLYEYQDNITIAHFQTYYGDGKENSKTETRYYDLQKRIKSEEIINYNKTKILYEYSKDGILNKIKEYESSIKSEDYKLLRMTKIKVNRKRTSLSTEAIKKINSQLI